MVVDDGLRVHGSGRTAYRKRNIVLSLIKFFISGTRFFQILMRSRTSENYGPGERFRALTKIIKPVIIYRRKIHSIVDSL